MEIAVHTPHIDVSDPDLADHVRDVLGRFSDRLTRVEVFIKDMNADKGGIDMHCTVEARPRGLDPIAIDHVAETVREALHGAVKKMQTALDRRFGKLDDVHR